MRHHGRVGHGGSGEAGKDLVDRVKGRDGGRDHALTVAVAPHESLVGRLRHRRRYVAVVNGGNVDHTTQVVSHPVKSENLEPLVRTDKFLVVWFFFPLLMGLLYS